MSAHPRPYPYPGYTTARLDPDQLAAVRELEERLGVVLIALQPSDEDRGPDTAATSAGPLSR
ncbi:MAG: hypothetical protein IRY95_06060 [Clostridia bacterium]|nr:hypothetical protein [Clostridia bacterium]